MSTSRLPLKQVKAMFAAGQVWTGTRIANGEAKQTERVVECVRGIDVIFRVDGKRYCTRFPKASEIQEARDGYLRFAINADIVVALTRTAATVAVPAPAPSQPKRVPIRVGDTFIGGTGQRWEITEALGFGRGYWLISIPQRTQQTVLKRAQIERMTRVTV